MREIFAKKRILILGFGKEGRDTLSFLKRLFPGKIIGIADQNTKLAIRGRNLALYLGKNYLNALRKYDVIIKSPGIPPTKIKNFTERKQIVTSQTEIFFDNCPGTIIGVTGTKGKSTTSSMIHAVLKAGGYKSHLVGNIGKPVLSSLFSATKKDIYVYELSSHQLQNLKRSPHISVFLNIYPEHLDYYKNLEEYSKAKANITLHQKKNDFLIYNLQNKPVKDIAEKSKAKKIPISGEYYQLDKNAAKAAGKLFKIPEKIISKTLSEFKYLPHRLENIGTFKGITFYNDALATIPEATMAALKFLGNTIQTIMLGGFERNIDFKNLGKAVVKSKIKTVILFPTTGEKIWRVLQFAFLTKGKKLPRHFFTDNMKDAVKIAFENTKRGKICLLSTASSSFSIFKDYKEKGNLFKRYVKKFAKK